MDRFVIKLGDDSSNTKSKVNIVEEKRKIIEQCAQNVPSGKERSEFATEKKKADCDKNICDNEDNIKCDIQRVEVSKNPKSIERWKNKYNWLILNENGKGICRICFEAVTKDIPLPKSGTAVASRQAFVDKGFATWKNACTSLASHERGELHRASVLGLSNLKQKTVVEHILTTKEKEMESNRIALSKIFTSVKFLVRQGLALRGHNDSDENSNLLQILKMRAQDVPELESWLMRSNYKWLSHDIINEIIDIFGKEVARLNLVFIKSSAYFAISLDGTTDVSKKEQISFSIRVVDNDLLVNEIFMGFYESPNAKAATLFKIVEDIFLRFNLPFNKLRGQCYDGASNMSGCEAGLQTLIRQKEIRALYVHCNPHNLNLVVQDGLENVSCARNFIGITKDLINFVRDSPKRLAMFKDLQSEKSPQLSPFYPTRWCVRIKSLKTIHNKTNYSAAIQFFEHTSMDRQVDSTVSVKAAGFLIKLQNFEFYFFLTLLIGIFDRIEILNAELQKCDLSVNEAHKKVKGVLSSLSEVRESKFESIWSESIEGAKELGLQEPKLSRPRKIPKRLEQNSVSNSSHVFYNAKDHYRRIYFEVLDQVLVSLRNRFQSETMNMLDSFEDFVIGKKESSIDPIIKFYNLLDMSHDFDKHKLQLHRDMFLEIAHQRKITLSCVREVVEYLKQNPEIADMVLEYKKLIQILMTIPASACTNERSFSALRRLKTYLRSTMGQERLNNVAILHVHQELLDEIEMDKMMNEFISRNQIRLSNFVLK